MKDKTNLDICKEQQTVKTDIANFKQNKLKFEK